MKVRIRFEKLGHMKFIGHLDLMRYFQKAIRRAKLPIKYSEGFSPHQIMSFASPLGIGMESFSEYMDIELIEKVNSKEAIQILNDNMVEGIQILDFLELSDDAKNSMSIVDSADYRVVFYESLNKKEIEFVIKDLLSSNEIFIEKKSKDKLKEVDIRANIYELKVEDDKDIFMNIGSGSSNSLKPELVIKAIEKKADLNLGKYKIFRLDLYAKDKVSLKDYGKEIL